MKTTRRPARSGPLIGFLLLLAGCSSGTNVTESALREARLTWDRAGVRDYNLEFVAHGPRLDGHFLVYARGGRVVETRRVPLDGREQSIAEADREHYGVAGLFRVIEDDLRASRAVQRDGPLYKDVVLKYDPDPKLGYPRRYRRQVSRSAAPGQVIDVIRLDIKPRLLGPVPPITQPPVGH